MHKLLFILQSYWKNILLAILTLALIAVISCYFIFKNNDTLENNSPLNEETIAKVDNNESLNEEVIEENNKTIHVDVKGAVKNAGVYEVSEGMMVTDVITLAGGFNKNAYQDGINLSKKVTDEMVIYVYTKSEIEAAQNVTKVEEEAQNVCTTPTYNICECVEENSSIIIPGESNTNQSSDNNDNQNTIVNINTANKEELTSISGIGESKAEAIISYREENGNFSTIEDIKNVSGIGDALFEKIKDYITV